MLKRLLSFFLSIIFVFQVSSTVVKADENSISLKQQSFSNQVEDGTSEIIEYIESRGYSVIDLLIENRTMYEELLKVETEFERGNRLLDLIRYMDDMILNQQRILNPSLEIGTYGAWHPIYSPAVEAIIAFFVLCDFTLSAELLSVAYNNNSTSTIYNPYCAYHTASTKTYAKIFNDVRINLNHGILKGNGTAEFEQGGNLEDNDLYYAIHLCNYD